MKGITSIREGNGFPPINKTVDMIPQKGDMMSQTDEKTKPKTIDFSFSRRVEVNPIFQEGEFSLSQEKLSKEIIERWLWFNGYVEKVNLRIERFLKSNDGEMVEKYTYWKRTEDEVVKVDDYSNPEDYFVPVKQETIEIDEDWRLSDTMMDSINENITLEPVYLENDEDYGDYHWTIYYEDFKEDIIDNIIEHFLHLDIEDVSEEDKQFLRMLDESHYKWGGLRTERDIMNNCK